jgi:hypothetical protein
MPPENEELPEWTGGKDFALAYAAGGTASYRNHLKRFDAEYPGLGLGPLDIESIRETFARAAAVPMKKRDSVLP